MGEPTSFVATDSELREVAPIAIKQCCAGLYESDAARLLLGDSFHPGGAKLTAPICKKICRPWRTILPAV